MDYNKLSDREIVDGILNNNKPVIEYFFIQKCSPLLSYILQSVFDGYMDKRELVNELFLYLAKNDWYKIRQFDFRSKLMTWVSVVAVRFFQKKREALIEKSSPITLNEQTKTFYEQSSYIDSNTDIYNAVSKIPNVRYRMVIERLDLQDCRPEELAKEMNVTVDNLYNIHRRALVQLRVIMGRKEDYYG